MQKKYELLILGWILQSLVLSYLKATHHNSSLKNLQHATTSLLPSIKINVQSHVVSNITLNANNILSNKSGVSAWNTTVSDQNKTDSTLAPIVCEKEKVIQTLHTNISCYPPSASLICFHDPFFCKKYFPSGKRELKEERPKYGEYSYLKHQHWFRVIQHGGIAFLFHPCTDKAEVEKLRQVASQCLHRYVLAPYSKLTQSMPLVLVSWGCYYMSSLVNASQMRSWIREHAYNGPASHVHTNGKFQENLVKQSKVITDEKDAILCPNKQQKSMFTVAPPVHKRKHNPESIINNRVNKIISRLKPGIEISANITITKVETGSAVWAAASLIFLCGILVGWLVYTKQWGSPSSQYKYNPLRNSKEPFECEPGKSRFNLLKSSQKIMSAFRWKDKDENKLDSMSKMNLMLSINEEDDDDEIVFQKSS